MHILFFHGNGSEQRSQHFSGPGRSYFAQDEADIDHVCNVDDVITFHVGHGVYRTYVVADCDGKTALLRLLRQQ